MGDKHFIIPALQADVKSMGYDPHNLPAPSDSTKVKICDIHPTRPLMMQVDGDGKVIVWEFNSKIELASVSTNDIFTANAPVAVQQVRRNGDSFIKQRLSNRSQMVSLCKADHILRGNEFCGMITASSEGIIPIKKSNAVHNIKSINFCDSAAIFANCYTAGKHSLHQSTPYSANSLLAVSDTSVAIYDYISKKGTVVSESELSKAASGADFIYYNCCAIGCVDGMIRLWDCKTNEVVKVLSGHNKGAVTVKALPIKSEQLSNSIEHVDKVRLLSIGADGVALIWDIHIAIGPNGSVQIDSLGIHPTAKLKDMFVAAVKSNIHYDCETNLLSISITDSKIKQWDLSDMTSVTRSSLRSTASSGQRNTKRLSVFGGGNKEQHDNIHGISCLGSIKPGQKNEKKIDVTAFCQLNAVQFTSDSFAIVSKTNILGIYKNREGSIGDDKSERSSVVGGVAEKSQRMQLLHEINISSILMRYLETTYPSVTVPEVLKEVLKTGALRVYTIKFQSSQPHIFVLGTSIGLLLMTLRVPQGGSLCGVHPAWGNIKLIHSGNAIRKVIMDGIDTKSVRRVPSSRQSFSTDDNGGADFDAEVVLDIISELSTGEAQGAATVAPKRLSFAPSTKKAAASSGDFPQGRPLFYASPSGEYCAIHWLDTMHYMVVKMDIAVRNRKDLTEVDRGYCIEFAWVGSDDTYLIKSAPFIATVGGKKRASVMNMLSTAEKEVNKLHSPQLILYRCDGDSKAIKLKFVCDALQGVGGATSVVHMHSGLLVAVTTEAKNDVVMVKNPAAAVSAEDISNGVIVADVEKAERDVKFAPLPSKSSMITRFYSLVTLAEAKRIEALAAEASNKPSGKIKKSKPKLEDQPTAVTTTEEQGGAPAVVTPTEDLSGFSLIQVGPTMKYVDAVRWNYTSGLCGVVMHDTVNVLKLQLESSNSVVMRTVGSAFIAPPVGLSVCITDMTWSDNGLYVATPNRVYVLCCDTVLNDGHNESQSLSHHIEVIQVDYHSPLLNARTTATSTLMAHTSGAVYSSLPWSQVVGVEKGFIYVYFRDGNVKKLNVSLYPAVAAFLLASSPEIVERRSDYMDMLRKLVATIDLNDKQIVKSMLTLRNLEV